MTKTLTKHSLYTIYHIILAHIHVHVSLHKAETLFFHMTHSSFGIMCSNILYLYMNRQETNIHNVTDNHNSMQMETARNNHRLE